MNYKAFSLLAGFLVWMAATILFRTVGEYFFLTDNLIIMIGLYIAVIPALGTLAIWIFRKYKLSNQESIVAAVHMVLPGMLFDAFCTQFFKHIFPNLPENAASSFGAWLMWVYAIVLIFGVLNKTKKINK
ncbi:MAG: DUF5367 domain-containing protein [Bacteroidota bacterium]